VGKFRNNETWGGIENFQIYLIRFLAIRIKFILVMKIMQRYFLNRLLGVGISGHWEVKFVLIPIIFFLPDVGKFLNGGRYGSLFDY
jgi:hypothetical protein